jgi:hypothetical protein
MNTKPLSLLLTFALASTAVLRADDKAVNRDQMLKELADIENKHHDAQEGSLNSVLAEVNAAAGSPGAALALYQKAVFQVEYDGKKTGREDFRAWQKKEDPLFHDANFVEALSLRLRYLSLTLQAIEGADRAKLAEPVAAYARELLQFPPDYADTSLRQPPNGEKPGDLIHELFFTSLNDGPIEKSYQIDKQISALKDWSKNPGDAVDILNQNVYPALRKAKSPLLITLWDERIGYESDLADGKNTLADQRERFESDTLPTLQWGRAKDLIVIGRADEGLREMFTIIKTYPLHVDNSKWIKELRDILKGGASDAAPAEQPAPAQ